ncbi:hypothetical protein GCM10022388_09690 [Flavobacterium chungnamense]|uniref:ATPase dynein-related AAA domain-containing protein n=2 Tax=Flavobacterium chungnamense TaxID=706182 RepID=A0ABP7UKW4_9FLAO
MRLNLSTMFTKISSPIKSGGNAGWNLEIGQSEKYNFTFTHSGVSEIFNGMLYNKVKDETLFNYGSESGEKKFKLISVFNNIKLKIFDVEDSNFKIHEMVNPFIFLLMEDDSESHSNENSKRHILKFKKAFKYSDISNDKFYDEIDNIIGLNTPWFGIEMNYYPVIEKESNLLVFDIIKCKKGEKDYYLDSSARGKFWNKYIKMYDNSLIENPGNNETIYNKINLPDHESGLNKIFYGAPGTGKSYKVDTLIQGLESKYYERVTFHPEFDNASFIGGYKPISTKDENGDDIIKYKFIPQSFTNIYARAWQNIENPYYMVIEEINRGNCAEIFGELFQLLDRNSNYSVSPSSELKEYLENEVFEDKNHEGIINGLKLPPNLNIYATMNTSDQSLFPMDSAFKRRWDWEYIPICYKTTDDFGKPNDSYYFEIDIENGKKYSWLDFIKIVNLNHIKINPSLGMDKCIGNYFIKPDNDKTISLQPFINKVIFYLWNDVFKDEDNKVFEENTSYEDFFPISSNGKKKINELFDRIELLPIKDYKENQQEPKLGLVAEDKEEMDS